MPALMVRNWFGRVSPLPPVLVVAEAERARSAFDDEPDTQPTWSLPRLAVTDALWGKGFQVPGGEIEVVRLVRPLGLTSASNFLLIGTGGGGPVCAVAGRLGLTVGGYEHDPLLMAAAQDLIPSAKLSRQATVQAWNPAEPELPVRGFHHGLALAPLNGNPPEPILAAISGALKPGGQLTLVELVADSPLDLSNAEVIDWGRLERRHPAMLPTEVGITRVLGRLGFEVKATEDISQRHMQQAILGWRRLVHGIEEDGVSLWSSDSLIREAELWTARLRLFRDERLRLVRWHLVGRGM